MTLEITNFELTTLKGVREFESYKNTLSRENKYILLNSVRDELILELMDLDLSLNFNYIKFETLLSINHELKLIELKKEGGFSNE